MSSTKGSSQETGARRRDGLLTTGDMARLSQNTLRTVRFYEEAGLLQPASRTDGGHRLFHADELCKLQLITDLRTAGLSIDEIRSLLQAKAQANSGRAASRQITERIDHQIKVIERQVALLTRVLAELSETRDVLNRCTDCTENELFPTRCECCRVMSQQEGAPPALSVLWSLRK